MINDDSLRAVASTQWTPQFIAPLYDSYCFAQIPHLARHALTGDGDGEVAASLLGPLAGRYGTVVLFFVDAFGWRFFERYAERSPFLGRIVREGMVSKLTSQFPSTTAAHVTAIHTGLPVGQSGVYEWFYYEPLVDRIIAPLYFSFAGDHERDTLKGLADPADLYPRHTLYQDLAARGVASFVFQHQDYTPSPYSDVVMRGARIVPYRTLPEALSTLAELLDARGGPSYYVLYFDGIDAIGHRHGPDSAQFDAEIDTFLSAMERVFEHDVAGQLDDTLFLMTADHGQAGIDPATTIYVNVRFPRLVDYVKTNGQGEVLAPAGAPRDLFLHIKGEYLDEARDYLQGELEGRAGVYAVAELIERGFFGTEPVSPAFRARVGNLVVLPYAGESVWWYEKGRFDQHYYGHHGGLTRAEMETILLARRYG